MILAIVTRGKICFVDFRKLGLWVAFLLAYFSKIDTFPVCSAHVVEYTSHVYEKEVYMLNKLSDLL